METEVRFTDERFSPTVYITWAGGSTFNIWLNTPGRDEDENIDVFTHYGDERGNPPTFEHAQQIAAERFDGWANGEIELWHPNGYRLI